MRKVIITAAITGAIHTPTMTPYLPVTPKQIIDDAVRSAEAGAAIAHIHVRDPDTGQPTNRVELFRQVAEGIKEQSDLIVCVTTGGGLGSTVQERLGAVTDLQPEMGTMNCGSLNFAVFPLARRYPDFKHSWEKPYLEATEDLIFPNTFRTMKEYCLEMSRVNTKPELEIYDAAMINNVAYLVSQGFVEKPLHLQFVMGVFGGIPASVANLVFLYERAKEAFGPDGFTWSVCAAGRMQLFVAAAALAMGGNVRVGLEDSLYIGKGKLARSSADQVEKVGELVSILDLEVATSEDARKILGLKGKDRVNF
jgi:uncharacterized protein (DUF849 family)